MTPIGPVFETYNLYSKVFVMLFNGRKCLWNPILEAVRAISDTQESRGFDAKPSSHAPAVL